MDVAVRPVSPLRLRNVVVDYGSFVLGPVSTVLEPGAIHCLVGSNGSGKSTLSRAVLGLVPTAAGSIWWGGEKLPRRDPRILRRVGVVSDSGTDVLEELTAYEYWRFCAWSYDRERRNIEAMLSRASILADRFELKPGTRQRISDFSLGMTRKTQIIGALIHKPGLLILDEPIVGLDFLSSRQLEGILLEECKRGAIVLMIGHDLGVVTRIADRIIALAAGTLVADSPAGSMSLHELESFLQAAFQRFG